jgi:hypothetical protein
LGFKNSVINFLSKSFRALAFSVPLAGMIYVGITKSPEVGASAPEKTPHAQTDEAADAAVKPLTLELPEVPASPKLTEFPLEISDEVVLTFHDNESYERAKNYLENVAYETYMEAPVSDEIRKAFVVADALTPYPYEFWQGQAFAESSFNVKALNEETLARGIMQMTPDTLLEILYGMKDKPQYGFIPEAQLVTRTFDKKQVAHYSVQDGIDKNGLIALVAYDPLKAVMVAAEFNSKYLTRLQEMYPEQEMSSVHAYLLHWQGYSGSQKIFDAKPETPAVDVYGAKSGVVQNHKTIFYEDPKHAKGERTVKDMLTYLQTNRGLGEIEIPIIAAWKATSTSVSYIPQSDITVAEKYKETLGPMVSLRPERRPASIALNSSQKPAPATLEPG